MVLKLALKKDSLYHIIFSVCVCVCIHLCTMVHACKVKEQLAGVGPVPGTKLRLSGSVASGFTH